MELEIEIYDKRERFSTVCYVKQIADNKFRMLENDVFSCRLTLGTEFETIIDSEGKHQIAKITKESEYITRRFFLSPEYKVSDYRFLGDELTKRGGFWQVDFGGIATANFPKDFEFDIDKIARDLNLSLTEIGDDE